MERGAFQEYLEAFEQQLKAEGKSSNTLTSYTRDAREFLAYLSKDAFPTVIDEILEGHVAGFIASLRGRELAERSKAKKLTSIRSFLVFCRQIGAIETYPTRMTYARIKPLVARILEGTSVGELTSSQAPGEPSSPRREDSRKRDGFPELRNTRRYVRVPFYREIQLRSLEAPEAGWYRGYGSEIGRGGMGLRVAWYPKHHAEVEVVFNLEDGGPHIQARGRIVYIDDTLEHEASRIARLGIQFTALPAELDEVLADWIAKRVAEDQKLFRGENTRHYVRIPFGTDARFRFSGDGTDVFEGVTLDLGINGVGIKSHHAPAADKTNVVVMFPVDGGEVEIEGEIVNRVDYTGAFQHMPATRLGIQFTNASEAALERISSHIRTRLKRPVTASTEASA